MRWRTINVLTNTPPRTAQRAPGGMQGMALMEPVLAKAARKLGLDEVDIHRVNAPAGKAEFGAPAARGRRNYVTSAFVKEALDQGKTLFEWDRKKAEAGKRVGSKVRGVGVAVSTYSAGSIGFDGLLVIRPDGKVQIQTGIGNLGTHCMFDVHRVAAEILGVSWDQCEVVFGDTSKHLPWSADARRVSRELQGRQRPRRQHDLRASRTEGHRTRREVRRSRAAGERQRVDQASDGRAGRTGPRRRCA
jgi:CO/xanthine dehydrogenase Mo-binding subunit